MIRYINMKGGNGIETIDEFDSRELQLNRRTFMMYLREMLAEYRMADRDNSYWISQRCTKAWRQR